MTETDAPEGFVHATYVGATPRHFPGLGLSVTPGDRVQIPQDVADEYGDVFHNPRAAAAPAAPAAPKKEGKS